MIEHERLGCSAEGVAVIVLCDPALFRLGAGRIEADLGIFDDLRRDVR
jgi:hypothetical protein